MATNWVERTSQHHHAAQRGKVVESSQSHTVYKPQPPYENTESPHRHNDENCHA